MASALVLAGGKSRRLGTDKRRLRVTSAAGLLEETIDKVAPLADEVLVAIGNDAEAFVDLAGPGIRFLGDEQPGVGPLGGIAAGLAAARDDLVLVVACDLPRLNVGLLQALLGMAGKSDLVVPRRQDGTLEMLQAVYRRSCLPFARAMLAKGRLRLSGLADELVAAGRSVRFVDEDVLRALDPELASFYNLNTPDDLRNVPPASRS
jgi:molybdopterin-guanine dinucleotide biosynthesis protein A